MSAEDFNEGQEIDKKIGMEFCMDDEDFYHEILETYIEESAEHKEALQKFLDEGDIENYTIRIHSVKSTSKTIGAMKFADKAFELEKAGKEGRLDDIKANHSATMEAYDKVLEEAKAMLNS